MKIIDNVYLFRPDKVENMKDIYHLVIDNGIIQGIHKGCSHKSGDEVIDGQQRTLMPSFTDSHIHLLRYGLMKKELDLRKVTTWDEVKMIVHDEYLEKEMEEHEWVVGRGIIDSQLKDIDHLLTAKDLKELKLDKPMFFLHDDGHECIVNDVALRIIKKDKDIAKYHDRFIEKDEMGNWTGRFKDTAVHFIKFHFREKSEEEIYQAVLAGLPHLLEYGITSVHTDDLNYAGSYDKVWKTYTDLEKQGKLPIRVYLHHYIYHLEDLENFLENDPKRTGDGTEKVRVGAIKIFLDGTQRLHTAAMRKPYQDKPETNGELIYTQHQLNEIVQLADDQNMQVTMHAIGDRTIEQAITALEKVGTAKMRHRIIHAQVLGHDLLERLAKLKPYIEIQPSFIMEEHDRTANWVGNDLEKYCNAWNSVDHLGIPYTSSSDSPIGYLSPMLGIHAAVNRTDLLGQPEGGWIPDEKLTVRQIASAYTETPAYLEFQENFRGKIEIGYAADFILLSENPIEVGSQDIKHIEVMESWVGGERVYKK
ncbi:putative amidohydrolase YtcJ [Bacillus pakistanensis]|uniref:Amidohydrolase YtcJ n=1 Tax=Rossellomorea pakistanensis TaxID=992288 RepID=A0ABS2NHP9_9BACI|nr:amidohydrolase [Bacillus pakistanensis]MBM7587066.1 putative amidohydrolase YtcJ [Bacillus pakistanensis]